MLFTCEAARTLTLMEVGVVFDLVHPVLSPVK